MQDANPSIYHFFLVRVECRVVIEKAIVYYSVINKIESTAMFKTLG